MGAPGNWPPRRHATAASRNWETRTAQRRQRGGSLFEDQRLMRLAITMSMVLLIAVGMWVWNDRQAGADEARPLVVATTRLPVATPTRAPTPTPTVRSARI